MDSLHPFKIFAGTKSQYMAEEICKELGVELGKMKIEHFADGGIRSLLRGNRTWLRCVHRTEYIPQLRQSDGTAANDRCG